LGRAETVSATVSYLLKTQTVKPTSIIVSCVTEEDAGAIAHTEGVQVITGTPGLAKQRNRAISILPPDTEIVVFFDDDFVAHRSWLEAASRAFAAQRDLVGFTGRVIADGILGPGLSLDHAIHLVEADFSSVSWSRIEPFSPYGCNMAFRVAAIGDARFDERLVLYGWLEDRDFGATLSKRGGKLIKSSDAVGVHMGVKKGRVAGDRLGYSQIVNPAYMLSKKTMTLRQAAGQMFRNVSSNVILSIKPEPFIDRRGRLRGNLLGMIDVLRGRLEPERASAIKPIVRKR
jgi:glycosyltransferase involved in cell wall biosynthesis